MIKGEHLNQLKLDLILSILSPPGTWVLHSNI